MKAAADERIVIRTIDEIAEIRAVEELQKEVWRISDIEVVPATQLIAASASGGVLLGAFDRDKMVGFAYGFVGHENGETVHHSHMLAVKPEYRSQDVGFRLKIAQRERVLEQGISTMTWTFDPLQSLNAYFNFGKLGVIAEQYFVDFYGEEAESFLHRNGTDRLWVKWLLSSEHVTRRLNGDRPELKPDLEMLVSTHANGEPVLSDFASAFDGKSLGIEIPRHIGAVELDSFERARRWRSTTRQAFKGAIAAGFFVEDFVSKSHDESVGGVYILSRKE